MPQHAHVFLSYLREDSAHVDLLKSALENAGVDVWQDRTRLEVGVLWQQAIVDAIQTGRFFLACFSSHYAERPNSGMRDELIVATELLRGRPEFRPWLVPLRLEPCEIPSMPIGGGQTLRDIQRLDLFPDRETSLHRLLRTLWRGETASSTIGEPTRSSSTLDIGTIEESRAVITNVDLVSTQAPALTVNTQVRKIAKADVILTGIRLRTPNTEQQE